MRLAKSNYGLLWLSFLFMPVLAFWYSIRNFEVKQYRIFILLFAMLAGYSLMPIAGSDGERYQSLLKEYNLYNLDYYINLVSNLYNQNTQITDVYSISLLFFVSRFTVNPAYFFMVVALFYYFVFIKLIDLIISFAPVIKHSSSTYFLIGCIFIFTFMLGINGVRWAMAFVVFSYGSLKFIKTGKMASVLISAISVLIHFSMIFSLFFLIMYAITIKIQNTTLLYMLLLISIIFTGIFTGIINSNIGLSGEAVQERYASYTNESYILFRTERFNALKWYALFDRYATYYFAAGALILSRLPVFRLNFDKIARDLFSFSIIMLIHSLFSGNLVDPLSNRYYLLVNFFVLIYLYYLFLINPLSKFMSHLSYLYLPILISHIVWNLRIDLDTISPFLVFGNSVILFLADSKESLWSFFFG